MNNDFDLLLFVAHLIPAILASQAVAAEFEGSYHADCTDTECVITMTVPIKLQPPVNQWANGDEILSRFLTHDDRLQATLCAAGEWTAVYQTQYSNGLWSAEKDAGVMNDECQSEPVTAPDPMRWKMKRPYPGYSSDWTVIFPRGPA